jgi:hypothetical protein
MPRVMTKSSKILFSFFITGIAFSMLSAWVLYIFHLESQVAPASLPSFSLTTDDVLWNGGYVSAKGTWTMEAPDEMGYPIRTSEIICTYRDKLCR